MKPGAGFIAIFCVLVNGVNGSIASAADLLGYKDLHVGMPRHEAEQVLKRLEQDPEPKAWAEAQQRPIVEEGCRGNMQDPTGLPEQWLRDLDGRMRPPDEIYKVCVTERLEIFVGSAAREYQPQLEFDEARLAVITVRAPRLAYNHLQAVTVARYGRPTRVDQTRETWERPDGRIDLFIRPTEMSYSVRARGIEAPGDPVLRLGMTELDVFGNLRVLPLRTESRTDATGEQVIHYYHWDQFIIKIPASRIASLMN